ncbi:MAG: hypothetical protein M1835_001898, partial [Candelina submexicana]
NIGFHFDTDRTTTIPDTREGADPGAIRKANIFKMQAASEAQRGSIKDWVRKNGSHADAATITVPEVASNEEFKELMEEVAEDI